MYVSAVMAVRVCWALLPALACSPQLSAAATTRSSISSRFHVWPEVQASSLIAEAAVLSVLRARSSFSYTNTTACADLASRMRRRPVSSAARASTRRHSRAAPRIRARSLRALPTALEHGRARRGGDGHVRVRPRSGFKGFR